MSATGNSSLPAVPTFAVVGRVNRGKSSIIATLAEEDSIAISPLPGTTRHCTNYEVVLNGQTLFTLVDTPGFEEAARALSFLQQTGPDASQRPGRVREFYETYHDTRDFVEECQLLRPILDGAAILYVVDGSTPFRENVMAEVEILRWTGRPRMALINRSAAGEHVEAWNRALSPAFSTVRSFDAHAAGFEERIRLLSLFRELVDDWQKPLSRAITALEHEQQNRLEQSARQIAKLVAQCVSHHVLVYGGPDGLSPRQEQQARERFFAEVRELESKQQDEVERLYRHHKLDVHHEEALERPVFSSDLFSERVWNSLGLSGGQLVATYSLAGATAGGTVDALVGGASFMAGAAIGAAVGGAAALFQLGERALSVTAVDGLRERLETSTEKLASFRVGPHQHPNFPFVVLDRALLHHHAVRHRAHALPFSQQVTLHSQEGPTRHLSALLRQRLARAFSKLRKNPDHEESRAVLQDVALSLIKSPPRAP